MAEQFNSPEAYKQRAAELREIARSMIDETARSHLLEIVQEYEALAAFLERANRSPKDPG